MESVTHMVAVVITAGRLHCRGRGRRIVCLSAFRTANDLGLPIEQRTTIHLRKYFRTHEDNDVKVTYLEIWALAFHALVKQFRQGIAQDIQEVRIETDSVAMDRVSEDLDEKEHYSRRP